MVILFLTVTYGLIVGDCVKLSYWFKASLLSKTLGIFQRRGEKNNFMRGEIHLMRDHIEHWTIRRIEKPQKHRKIRKLDF